LIITWIRIISITRINQIYYYYYLNQLYSSLLLSYNYTWSKIKSSRKRRNMIISFRRFNWFTIWTSWSWFTNSTNWSSINPSAQFNEFWSYTWYKRRFNKMEILVQKFVEINYNIYGFIWLTWWTLYTCSGVRTHTYNREGRTVSGGIILSPPQPSIHPLSSISISFLFVVCVRI